MDGEEMNEEEINVLKKIHTDDPEMILNPKEFALVRDDLREALPSGQDIPHGDFFSSTLLNRIEREASDEDKIISLEEKVIAYENAPKAEANVIPFSWGKMAAAMAACLVVGFLLSKVFQRPQSADMIVSTDPAAGTATENAYTPVVYSAYQNVSADYIQEGRTNVIVIEGLEALPDDIDLFDLAQKSRPILVKPNTNYEQDENQ